MNLITSRQLFQLFMRRFRDAGGDLYPHNQGAYLKIILTRASDGDARKSVRDLKFGVVLSLFNVFGANDLNGYSVQLNDVRLIDEFGELKLLSMAQVVELVQRCGVPLSRCDVVISGLEVLGDRVSKRRIESVHQSWIAEDGRLAKRRDDLVEYIALVGANSVYGLRAAEKLSRVNQLQESAYELRQYTGVT